VWEATDRSGSDFDIAAAQFFIQTFALAAVSVDPKTTGPTSLKNIVFKVAFNADVINFNNAADLIITHNGTANTGVSISGGPRMFTVRVVGISGQGSFTMAVNTASDVRTPGGNPLISSVTSPAVNIVARRPRPHHEPTHHEHRRPRRHGHDHEGHGHR
jgi:hypothetical protein